jgi:hypothetical protein
MTPAWVGLLLALLTPLGLHAQPVTVTITAPTTASLYVTQASTVLIQGTVRVRGRRQIASVTCRTDHGASVSATGTTPWSCSLTLPQGQTQVTVEARDSGNRTGTDVLTVTVLTQTAPITLLWDYSGGGETFQVERCTVPCGPMAAIASVAIGDRTWIDTNVARALDYCYRLAAVSGGTRGPYSATGCSP